MPKTVVAILNWNGREHLLRFLPSVIMHSPHAEIVVIDNASTDDSLTVLAEKFPTVKIIVNAINLGYAGGYKEGLKNMDADYFVLLNSDVEVTPGWLDPVISQMESDPSVAAAQPKIKSLLKPDEFEYAGASGGFIDKDFYPFCRGRIFDCAEKDKGQYNDTTEVFWATGACLFVRKSDYFDAGELDPEFFAHMEEIDLCWRMKNRGKKIMVVPQSEVFHLGGGTLNYQSPDKTYLNFRNNLFLIHKNYYSGNLFFKIIKRLILDGIAGAKFLFSGKFRHTAAIIRSHYRYYRSISHLNKKRKLNRKESSKMNTTGIYDRSIIIDYYFRKKKKFSELLWAAGNRNSTK